jgi:hypothetical protein
LILVVQLKIKFFFSPAVDVATVVCRIFPHPTYISLTLHAAGQVTNSQLFPFSGGADPLALTPENAAGSFLTVKGKIVDIAACNAADPNQQFGFGSGGVATRTVASSFLSTAAAVAESAQAVIASGAAPAVNTSTTAAVAATVAATTAAAATTAIAITALSATTTTAAAQVPAATGNPTSVVSVSRARIVLNPSTAAEANIFDNTATRLH